LGVHWTTRRAVSRGTEDEPNSAFSDSLNGAQCLLARRHFNLGRQRIMGNGNFDLGKKRPIRGLLRPIMGNSPDGEPETRPDDDNHPKIELGKTCGAMSEQHGHGNESSPQKFIHLVGCRDPKAGTRKRGNPRLSRT
jgi:hypothetical protein